MPDRVEWACPVPGCRVKQTYKTLALLAQHIESKHGEAELQARLQARAVTFRKPIAKNGFKECANPNCPREGRKFYVTRSEADRRITCSRSCAAAVRILEGKGEVIASSISP